MFGDFLRIGIPLPFGANLKRFAAQFQGRTGKLSLPHEATKHGSVFVVGRFCCSCKPCLFDFTSTVFLLGYQYMVMFRNSEKAPEKCWERETKGASFLCNIDFFIYT